MMLLLLDGIAVVVNNDNKASQVSMAELADVLVAN